MTSRERFEAWAGNPLMMGMRGDKYHNDHVQIRWEAWQAAERDMLERAIAVFSSAGPKDTFTAALIRVALKELLNEQ